ncbi:hypothetical protein CWD78_17720 [Dickeya dadantii]|nr:hypothetical protein [Dickeya dadantii]
MVISYPIIICDIKGVGKSFGSNYEGGYVIEQIRQLYPDKYIIAMSAEIYKITFMNILENADDKIMRDSGIDVVSSALNKAFEIMQSNKERWCRLRNNLISKHKVDLYDVWEIEQEFIKSSLNSDRRIFENSRVVRNSKEIVRGILINFISGLIL